jgi:anti-sigma factor ChrR (cupin superfamily)
LIDVARYESGDLSLARRATIQAHSGCCARCGTSLADIRQAREEILGSTANSTSTQSRHAAEEIRAILRRALH